MGSRVAYTALVLLLVALRLVELRLSRRNISRLLGRGAIEVGRSLHPWMVAMHAGWLASCVLEVWLLRRPWLPPLAAAAIAVLVAATALRYWVIRVLGERWSTRVVFVPGDEIATTGPYRWLRHPNYLGVILEILALPLVHSAWLTAGVFSVLNVIVIKARIVDEEQALRKNSHYDDAMGSRRRVFP